GHIHIVTFSLRSASSEPIISEPVHLEQPVAFTGSFGFPSVPLVRKPSISFASNPSSIRISSLCSPRSGARFCRFFSDAVHRNRTADRVFQVPASALERNDNAVLAQLRVLDDVTRIPHKAVSDVGLVENFAPVRHRLRAEDLVHDSG